MRVLVLSSRTGKALKLLHALYPVHTAVSLHAPPPGVAWILYPKQNWSWLREQNFDIVISLGFMSHIPNLLFEHIPTFNVHPGKLPAFKGKDPHIQALKAGVEWTAVTIHKVTEEIDCGDILMEVPVRINKNDTPTSLEERLRLVAVYATASLLYGISKGECNER